MQINNGAYANFVRLSKEREVLKGQLSELEIPLGRYLEGLSYGA